MDQLCLNCDDERAAGVALGAEGERLGLERTRESDKFACDRHDFSICPTRCTWLSEGEAKIVGCQAASQAGIIAADPFFGRAKHSGNQMGSKPVEKHDQNAAENMSEEDMEMINVDFDFAAPSESDVPALKRLLQQQWYTHAPQLQLHSVAEHIVHLGMNVGIGTVVKVDDLEQIHDPYALMSCMDLGTSSPATDEVRNYFISQLSRAASAKPLLDLVQAATESKPILYIIHERMINLPPQLMPPLLRMLLAEVKETLEESSKPAPTHVLFFSRAFSADALDEGRGDDDDDEPTGLAGARKRKAGGLHARPEDAANAALGKQISNKKRSGQSDFDDGLGSFHPEDELIREFASHSYTYRFPPPRDAEASFEPPLFGRLIAVPYAKMSSLLDRLHQEWPEPTQ